MIITQKTEANASVFCVIVIHSAKEYILLHRGGLAKSIIKKAPARNNGQVPQLVKNASQSFVRKDEIRFNPFFDATCAWRKIHISLLQVHRVSGDVSVKMLRRSILTDSSTRPKQRAGASRKPTGFSDCFMQAPGREQWPASAARGSPVHNK